MSNVLVVEDIGYSRMMIVKFLKKKGYTVFHYESAEDGLKALGTRKVDFIILDLSLRGMSGIEFLKYLQSKSVDIPVIVTTADISFNTKKQVEKFKNVISYMEKPVDLNELEMNIRNYLNKKILVEEDDLIDSSLDILESEKDKYVLIVEDMEKEKLLYKKLLDKLSLHSIAVSTGEEMIEQVRKKKPVLIIMDLQLYGTQSIDYLEAQFDLFKDIPIILISAYISQETIIKGTRLNIKGFFVKPIDIKRVTQEIKKYV